MPKEVERNKKKTKTEDRIIKDKRNLLKPEKENEVINDRIIKNIKKIFEFEDYYKPVRVGYFHSNNYIECKNNGDKNNTLSIKEDLDKIKLYLKAI